MMKVVKISKPTYYLREQSAEYYLGGEWPVRILGAAAITLGVTDRTTREGLANLLAGFSTDGSRRLVQDQQYRDVHQGCGKVRQKNVGWDVTFSPDKLVSVYWAMADEATRRKIEAALEHAVEKAIGYLEREAAFTRRGQGGSRRERVKLLAATFTHPASRAGDPQLHVHAVVFNIGLRRDGTTGTIVSKPLFDHQKVCGSIFRTELANRLPPRIAQSLVNAGHDRESDLLVQVCEHFSTRSRDIRKRLADPTRAEKDATRVALASRPPKGQEPPLQVMLDRWRAEVRQFGIAPEDIQRWIERPLTVTPTREFKPILAQAVRTLNEEQDVFVERDIVQHALDASTASGLDADLVITATREHLRNRRDFIRLATVRQRDAGDFRESRYMNRATNNTLSDIERMIRRLSRDRTFVIRNHVVEGLITQYSTTRHPVLEEMKHHRAQLIRAARRQPTRPVDRNRIREQAAVTLDPRWAVYLRGLLQAPGRVVVMNDWPSAHRDLALKAAAEAWGRSGQIVLACTRRLKDAKRLEASTGISTISLRRFELKSRPDLVFQLRWHAMGLVRTAFGVPAARLSPPPLERSQVLIVDRADTLRPQEIRMIVEESDRHGAKVVLLMAPRADHHRGRNPATANLLSRCAVSTWRHPGRSWQPDLADRRTPAEHQRPQELER